VNAPVLHPAPARTQVPTELAPARVQVLSELELVDLVRLGSSCVFFYNFIFCGGDASRMWCAAAQQLCPASAPAAAPATCQGTGRVPACGGPSTACPQRQCLVWRCSGRTFRAPCAKGARAGGRKARCTQELGQGTVALHTGTAAGACAGARYWAGVLRAGQELDRVWWWADGSAALRSSAPQARARAAVVLAEGAGARLRCGAGRPFAPAGTGCQPTSCGAPLRCYKHRLGSLSGAAGRATLREYACRAAAGAFGGKQRRGGRSGAIQRALGSEAGRSAGRIRQPRCIPLPPCPRKRQAAAVHHGFVLA